MFDRWEPHDKCEPSGETEFSYEVHSSIDIDEVYTFGTRDEALKYIADYRKSNIGEDSEFTDCLVIKRGAEAIPSVIDKLKGAIEYYERAIDTNWGTQ